MLDLLLNETFMRRAIAALALATPLLALLLALLLRAMRRATPPTVKEDSAKPVHAGACLHERGTQVLLLLALAGPSVWLLWKLYETIMNAAGFASVRGLLICLLCFALLGAAAGWALSRLLSPPESPTNPSR